MERRHGRMEVRPPPRDDRNDQTRGYNDNDGFTEDGKCLN
jgi:hypothetical protein